ncbi:CBS domain-containing protein [Pullulanibacillus sp. KACC 23026]|uniref:CBS domain-containing protein n=1 Tax=Pullulanibacillus sp. KACC 23026 TaxID=3028315 RepID=UPI0023AF8954|nr:CBS domain-containing protein [Pullulanibacillus sp. KACC 23026]WEG11140.1 CBS domain-containing protein [Pullulanibacillus sp. KACC 23026]
MALSDRFIQAFNRIDQILTPKSNRGYQPFQRRVREYALVNATVKRHQYDLLKFADLRNVIVHEYVNPNFVIAEPHESTVKKIELIEKELTNPTTVISLFSKNVKAFTSTDTLTTMLTTIREKAYSQFPIYEGTTFIGLLTENGITNWLARNIEQEIFSLNETQLGEIVSHEEESKNFIFINRDTTLDEAEELFKGSTKKGIKLDALLITHNGKSTERLLGIITIWDFIEISGHKKMR